MLVEQIINGIVLGSMYALIAQGYKRPVLGNALILAGAFPQAVGTTGQNVHTIGFNSNEPAPQIKGQDEYAARYVKFATVNTKLPQPINVANTTLAYDAVTRFAANHPRWEPSARIAPARICAGGAG